MLLQHGRTDYTLTVSAGKTSEIQFAVRDLQEYWKKCTGVDLKLGKGTEPRQIILQKDSSLRSEESMMAAAGDHLVLSGGDDRGVMYAVYTFLERCLGVRWFTPWGDELTPVCRQLVFTDKVHREKPSYGIRCSMPLELYGNAHSLPFFLRNRVNFGPFERYAKAKFEASSPLPVIRSAVFQNGSQAHTFFHYITARNFHHGSMPAYLEYKDYFKSNPEYFTLTAKGKRTPSQLCFGNPELRREFTRRFIQYLGMTGRRGVYSISAMDWPGEFCHCPRCQSLKKKYGCVGAPLYDYLVELCNHIRQDYPEVMISTLAYRKKQSEQPPNIQGRLPDNLVVIFAPIDDDFSKPMNHPSNADTWKNLQAWGKIARHLWVWYYPLAYGRGGVQGGVERVIRDTQAMQKAGVTGTYYEHDLGVQLGLNFVDLMQWVFLQLFQHPEADAGALVREFCDFYYGAASPLMQEYIGELDRIYRTTASRLTNSDSSLREISMPENLVKFNRLFNRMEQRVAADAKALQHVREIRLELDLQTMRNGYMALRRDHPQVFPEVKELEKRIKDTMRKSVLHRRASAVKLVRRGQDVIEYFLCKPFVSRLEEAVLMASCEPRPLPEPFASMPEKNIRQAFPSSRSTGYFVVEKDPEAALGYAIRDRKKPVELPFTCGFWDPAAQRHVLNTRIERKDLVVDRYHFYKLGDTPIPSQNCMFWAMSTWGIHLVTENFFTMGEGPEDLYELWVSLKFQGPAYGSASTSKVNRVLLDRIICVKK